MRSKKLLRVSIFTLIMLFALIPKTFANDDHNITTSDIITLVEQLEQEGQFVNGSAVRALTIHLTALRHFEQKGQIDKLIEHMNSFNILLEHQRTNELISEAGYISVKDHANAFIQQWTPLVIVDDGQVNATIMMDHSSGDLERFAASELQETIQKISGATLPIVTGDMSGEDVSITLPNNELYITKSGKYSFQMDVMNNSDHVVNVAFTQTAQSGLQLQPQDELELSRGDAKSQLGTLHVPSSTEDGTYIVMIQPNVDGVDFEPLRLTVQLDRNIIYNPSFELGMEGWYADQGVTEIDTNESYSGNQSLKMVQPGYATSFPDLAWGLHLETGKDYVFKAWMKGETEGRATIRLRSIKRGVGDVYPEVYRHDVQIGTDWTYVELTFTQDPELDYDYNLIAFWNKSTDAGGTGTLWIDDVTLSLNEETDTQPDPTPHPENGDSSDSYTRTQIVLATPETHPNLSELFANDLDFLAESDGFAIRRVANRIYIFGSNSRGLLNGVYDFLEENTGILWTRSTEVGTIYDPQATIMAERVDYREKSPFAVRGWLMAGAGGNGAHNDLNTSAMFTRNKLNVQLKTNLFAQWEIENFGLTPINLSHNLKQWLPNEEYFDSHPEYYHWENGQYVPISSRNQLNFYHPDLPYVFADKIKDLHSKRGYEYIGVGIEDNQNWTQSPESQQPFTTPDGIVVEPQDPAYKSTVFFTFLNKVASEVKQTYPDVKIVSYAYFFLAEPPKVELEDNIVIVMAPVAEDIRVPLNTDNQQSRNYEYKLQLEEWVTKTKNIMMYNYYGCCYANAYERPIAERVQADAQYYRDLGIMGFIPEGIADYNRNAWGVNAMQFWLFHQIFWNPDADLEKLKNEYIEKAYGDAAAPMKQYYDLIEQGWEYDQLPITIYSNESQLIGHYIVKAGIQESAQTALDEAWALADDQARARIEPIRTTFMEMVAEYGDAPELTAEAVKTTATKEEILQSLDFQTAPWTEARPITEMVHRRTSDPAPVETKVYLLWDDENLYVGYENFDDHLEEMVVSDDAPSGWWQSGADDAVETHLSSGEPGSITYAFFTNPNNVHFGYRSGPTYVPDAQFESSSIILNDRWNSVQVIPFSSFGVDPQSTGEFQALFVRNFHGNQGIFTWGGGNVWSPGEQNTVFLIE